LEMISIFELKIPGLHAGSEKAFRHVYFGQAYLPQSNRFTK